jgi:predicted metalloprotease
MRRDISTCLLPSPRRLGMRLPSLSLVLAMLQYAANPDQIPLQTSSDNMATVSPLDSKWTDLTARADANATSQLIFDSVNSILQHWTHTRYRNGRDMLVDFQPNLTFYAGAKVTASSLAQCPLGPSSTMGAVTTNCLLFPNGLQSIQNTHFHFVGFGTEATRTRGAGS